MKIDITDSSIQMNNTPKVSVIVIMGLPNAGKSTLLNRIVGSKAAIVTPKAQTTRENLAGIHNIGETQLIFIDTPGISSVRPSAQRRLEQFAVRNAFRGIKEADILLFMFDAKSALTDEAQQKNVATLDMIKPHHKRCHFIAAVNKVDTAETKSICAIMDYVNRFEIFKSIFCISGLYGTGIDALLQYCTQNAQNRPWHYDKDMSVDTTERKIAEELTREQLYFRLQQELPYDSNVETELWKEQPNGSTIIHQVIHVTKESQKKIVLGADGYMIKAIGSGARAQIEHVLGRKVHLFLHVKVKEDWMELLKKQ